MRDSDPRPARLYNIGGNTALAIPRAHCRQLGLTPRCVVLVSLTDDGRLLITPMENTDNDGTPVRQRGAKQTP